MTNREEIIWKYLDEAATPAERAQVERLQAEDPAFRAALLERQRLRQSLREQEAEQPSLRFAQNIMDRLPVLYRRTLEPLVRPFWIRFFLTGLALFLIGYFGLVAYWIRTGRVTGESPASTVTGQITGFFSTLPSQVLTMTAALSLGYLGLVLLDRQLKKRLLNRKTE